MSYCRWSSDSYRSDVFCHRSDRGFETHVAALRRLLDDDVRAPDKRLLQLDAHRYDAALLAFTARIDSAPRLPIGLEHDGAVFVDGTEDEMFARIVDLADLGYRVPTDVLGEARTRTSNAMAKAVAFAMA